jgi:hypothetical protein
MTSILIFTKKLVWGSSKLGLRGLKAIFKNNAKTFRRKNNLSPIEERSIEELGFL